MLSNWSNFTNPVSALGRAAGVGALGFCLLGSASALQLRVFTPSKHERFTGFPAAPARNPFFIHAALDLSGVGWSAEDPQKQFTLISPLHFAGANHFRPSLHSMLNSLSQDGTMMSREVTALTAMLNDQGQPTDVLIGTLGTPIPAASGVTFLPYLNLDTDAAYVGQALVVLGRNARGGRGTIAATADFGADPLTSGAGINTTRTFSFNYQTTAGLADDAYAEAGDSGSPCLVVVGGRPALAGTHTAVLNALGTITTVDSLLPFYAAKINNYLFRDGYHLTQATPKSVAPTVSQQAPALIRAGYLYSLLLTVANPSLVNEAHNLKLSQQWDAAQSPASGAGSGWVVEAASEGRIQARRGGLAAGGNTAFSVTGTIRNPGTGRSTVQLSADGVTAVSQQLDVRVVESYRSWSRELTASGPADDPDHDGVDNLCEYAFGGEPAISSQVRTGTTVPLVPVFRQGGGAVGAAISWLQRRDAAERALAYVLESSQDLSAAGWSTVTPASGSAAVLDSDFETITAMLPTGGPARSFFRVRIALTEQL